MAVPYVPVDTDPTTSAATTGNDTMQSAQYAVVYDLISEGEIQGLVDGAASIYLNGTPLTSQSTKSNITPIAVTNGVFTAGSTTVTHAAGGLANTVGRFAILERGANTNATFAGTSGSSRLTTTSAYFTSTMAVNNEQFPILNSKIRIDGLGPNGTEYIGTITQFISSTAAIVEPPISTTGSNKTGARDHVSYVTTASATSITIAAAPTLSGRRFQLVPLTSSATSYTSDDSWNFKNVTMNFRAGTREQTPIIYPNIPSASFLSSVEAPFLWTTGWGGNASVLNYNSAFLGLASPGEVDKLKIGIEFPGGLYKHNGEQQQIRDSFLGLQLKFQYTQGGQVKTALILGPASSAGVPAGVQRHGDWLNYLERFTGLVQARIQTPFIHDIEFSVEQFKPFTDFTILISRTSPDDNTEVQSNDDSHVFAAKIKYIESQIVDKFRYPHSAYAAISFPAEGFSSIPTRSYKARGLKISVPSNYIPREENVDGIARYIGRWDGSFITKYTNNPAWIFYDLATNKRYGLGKYVDSSLIDKFGLYRIARYCDELVSNGKGGLEPRFTCNVYITQAEEAYKLLRDLATTFRGMTYWAQGALMVSQDRPKEPIYTFTQGNVVDGIFNYEYSGRNARFNEVNITWTNPDQFYQQDVLTVTDQTDIIKRGRIVSMDTVAFGCTSESQAYRVALWNMMTSQLETEFISFTSGINASTLLPGDIINVQDHHLKAIQTSGRIKSAASATSITLDRDVTLTQHHSYVLHIVYDGPGCYLQQPSANVSGTIYYRGDLIPGVANSIAAAQLLDIAGSPVAVSFSPEVHVQKKAINNVLPYTGNVITVSSSFSSTPNTESIWAIENITHDIGVEPKKYRVLSIREEPNALYTIIASNYAEEKFEELEAKVKIAVPPYVGPRPGEDVPPVTVMIPQYARSTVDDLGQEVDAAYFALISWSPPNQTYTDSTGNARTRSYPYVSTYEVRYDFFDIPSTTLKEYVTETVPGTRNSLEVYGVNPGNYEISIRVKNTIGEYSPWYTQRITFERQGSLPGNLIKGLKPGGAIDSGVIFNSNTFTILDSYYTYTNPSGTTYTVQPATSAQSAQSFANLRSNSTFYLLWDASNTADPLKAVQYYSDPNVADPYGAANSYWIEAGSANNGLLTLPGTVTVTQFTNKVTGTGTFFNSNLSIGNLVKLHDSSNNANAFYAVVASISSNTELYTREIIQKPYTAKQLQTLSFKTNYKDDALLAQITTGAGNTANLTIQYVTSTVNEPQLLVLDTNSSGFRYDGNNALIGPTSITFAVNRQNLLGPTNWYVFDANNNSLSNSVLETRTNTSAIINSTSFGNISNNNFIRVRTDVDTLTSNATIFKIRDGVSGANGAPGANGANGTSGVSAATLTLSKASVTLFAYADGNVDGYTDAAGQASLYLGNTNVTESTTWASSATIGLTGTISNTSGSKGQYSVSNLATANNTGALTITATYSGLTYTGVFSVSKAKGGYEIASTLPSTNLFQGRVVFLTTDNKLYRYTGTAWTTVINESDIANGAISTAKFAASIEPVTIANSALALPTTRSTEYINWTNRLYRWNGSAYVAAVSNTEMIGTIINNQLADAAVSTAKFASGIEPVTISTAGTLPTTKSTEYINWSGRLYRWNGSAYIAAVSNTELLGTIVTSQFASGIEPVTIANSAAPIPTTRSTEYINWSNRLYRWNGSAYIAAVSNTEMVGTIISTQLANASISIAKFASGIEPVTIANSALALPTTRSTEYINWSNRLYRWNGSAYIAAVSNTELLGTIVTSQFASGIEPVTISTAGTLPTTRSTEYINWSGRLYRWNGSAYIAAVSNTEMIGTIISSQLADAAVSTAKFASGIEPVTIANSALALPTTRSTEYINWSNRLYRWNGSAYIAAVSNTEMVGTIISSQLADAAVSTAKFASGIEPVTIANSALALPTTRSTEYINWSNRLYRWNGSAYIAAVSNTEMLGTIINSQIANSAISELKLADNAVAAAKIQTGAITASKLNVGIGGGNLFRNTSFEAQGALSDNNWLKNLSFTESLSTTQKYFGTQSLKLVNSTSGLDTFMFQNMDVAVQPNTTYMFSAWAYVESITGGALGDRSILAYDGVVSNIGQSLNASTPTGVWRRYSCSLTTSAAPTVLSLRLYSPNGTVYWDAVQVEIGDVLTAYAPRPDEILPGTIGTTQIANDAITSDKIIAGAIISNKITVNTLEGDRIKANTLDAAKIVANSITSDQLAANSITVSELAANSVVAVKIQAGAITSEKITSGAITTNKLYVVPMGSNLVPDSFFTDATAWNDVSTGVLVTGITDANVGSTAIRNADNVYNEIKSTSFIEVNRDKKYRYEVWAKQLAGTAGAGYLGMAWYSASKTLLESYIAQPSGAGNPTGWGNGTYSYFGIGGQSFPANWTRYSIQFGAGESAAIPSNARYMKPVFLLNYQANTGVQHAVTGVRVEEKTDAELIVDGSITTNKITVNSLSGDRISAGTLDASKIVANSITANQIAAAAISADEIAAGAINADKIAAGAVTTSKLTVGDFSVLNKNWNFEEGDVAWTKESGWTINNEPANAKSGNWVANCTFTSPTALKSTTLVPTSSGEVFYGEAYIKFAAGSTGTGGYVRLVGLDSGGGVIWTPAGNLIAPTTTSYTFATVTATVPANVTTVYLDIVSQITAGKTFVDEIRMFRVSNSTLIANGAITTDKITVNSLSGDRISAGTLDASKIVANSITGNQIAASAISADEIAAGAIRTDKLLVIAPGSALNADPGMRDASAWASVTGPLPTFTTITDGKVGNHVARSTAANVMSWINETVRIPVDSNKTYRVRAWVRTVSGANNIFYVGTALFAANGSNIQGDGSQWYYAAAGTAPATFTEYVGTFGAGTAKTFPADARTMSPLAILSYYVGVPGSTIHEIQDLRIEEVIPGTLIQDGAITTNKITVNSLSGDRISAGTLDASKIVANSITANQIAASAISADEIAAGAIRTDKLLVAGQGSAINDDPQCKDSSAWAGWNGDIAATVTAITDGKSGNSVLRASTNSRTINARLIPISDNKVYRVSAWVRQQGNGSLYLRTVDYPANETSVQNGIERSLGLEAVAPPSATWTYYSATYTPTAGRAFATPQILLAWGGSSGYMEAQDVRLEEILPSTLIANGAITTDKITVNSLSGDRISAGTLDATKIVSDSITAAQIQAGAISASEIAAGAVRANHLLITPKSLVTDPSFEGGSAAWTGFVQRLPRANANVPANCPTPFATEFSNRDNMWNFNALDVQPGETYKLSIWVSGGSTGSSSIGIVGYGYLANGTITQTPVISVTASSGWQRVSGNYTIPADIAQFRYGAWANRPTYTGNSWFSDITVEKVSDSTLIADGAITTNKITVGSLNGDRISANTLDASKIVTDSITAAQIQAGAISASEIAAGAITTSKLAIGDFSVLNKNPGFEEGDINWDKGTNWSVIQDSANSRSGSWVARKTTGGGSVYIYSANVPANPGDVFYGEAYIKHSAGVTGSTRVVLRASNSTGGLVGITNGTSIPGSNTSYSLSSIKYVMPANTASVLIGVLAATTGGEAYADDVRLFRAANSSLIADGAITGTLIQDGAITTNKITVGSLNGDRITANTLDASKIVADSITAAQIQAGAISADEIAAGAIRTDKLLVSGKGSALNADPAMQDTSAWVYGGHGVIAVQQTVSDGKTGNKVYRSSGNSASSIDTLEYVPVSSGKTYRLSAWVRRSAVSDGIFYIRLVDQTANQLSFGGAGLEGFTPTTTWTNYETTFIPTTSQTSVKLRAILSWSNSTTNGYHEITDFRLEEILPGTLIQDGAITTNKITANSLSGDRITAGTLDASKIVADSITAAQIQAGAISASEIAAGAITTGKLLVMNPGASLHPDATFEDQSSWAATYGGTLASFKIVTDAPAGRYVAFCPNGASGRSIQWHPISSGLGAIPIDRTRNYRFSFYYRTVGGASGATSYATLQERDSTGALIGTNGGHTFYLWSLGAVDQSSWTKVEAIVGSANFTANARFVCPSFLLNWESAGAEIQISNVRLEPLASGTLIEDGAITTNKITVNSLNGDRISAGTLDASKIVADSITAGQIQAGAISASEIASGAITTAKLAVADFSVLNKNWNFEEGDISWTKEGNWSITIEPANAKSGSWVANNTSTTPAALRNNMFVPTSSGEVFYAEAYIKHAAGTTGTGSYVRLRGLSNTSVEIWNPAGNVIGSGTTSYVLSSIKAVVPSDVVTVNVEVVSNITAGKVFADEVRMFRVANTVLIADGAVKAEQLAANSVVANKIDVGAVTAAKINVTQLSSISANVGTINAGTINVANMNIVGTSTTALNIKSAASGERMELGSSVIKIFDSAGTLRVKIGNLA